MKAHGRTLFLGVMMVVASLVSVSLTPKLVPASTVAVKLSDQVPLSFGDWRTEPDSGRQVVSPQVEKTLESLYSDTLSRTYVNSKGERIMLSLAYGANQGRDLQVHKPEVCYVAQGFLLNSMSKAQINLGDQALPVMHLVAVQGRRNEPITYWIRSGDSLVRGWYEQNKARISAGLNGVINDGFLVRVSSISGDENAAFELQQHFINDMLLAIPAQHKHMFLGKSGA
jgi:EpsI family protein